MIGTTPPARDRRTIGRRPTAVLLALLAVLAAGGSVWSWTAARSPDTADPLLAGEPVLTVTVYSPPMLALALLAATAAGVLAVLAVARWRSVGAPQNPDRRNPDRRNPR